MTPTTLRSRNAIDLVACPFFPRMRIQGVLPIRLEKLHQFEPLLIGKARTYAYVLQLSCVVVQSQQQ
jgi:hypothetical protein